MVASNRIAHIFVDEYGTPSLDIEKRGVLPYFVYAAVIIPGDELDKARLIHDAIVKDSFQQQGYIKSSSIPNNPYGYAKYIDGATKLNGLQHHVIALVIDKGALEKDSGLSIKKSFIKYFQRLLSLSFDKCYDEFHIIADETGWPDFNNSLEAYMHEKAGIEPTLFSNNSFQTDNDISGEPLIQLADFYAGIIGRYYCGKFDENRSNVIHNIIRTRISIEWFPNDTASILASTISFTSTFDINLFQLAKDSASRYVDGNPQDRVGCELIAYIVQEAMCSPNRHISSKEIKAHLSYLGIEIGDPIVKISELRDKGVIIISPIGKKGYKFPTNEKEIAEFLNRLSGNIIPQLRRGFVINKILAEKSFGKYNVLSSPEFELLRQLSSIVNKQFM